MLLLIHFFISHINHCGVQSLDIILFALTYFCHESIMIKINFFKINKNIET